VCWMEAELLNYLHQGSLLLLLLLVGFIPQSDESGATPM